MNEERDRLDSVIRQMYKGMKKMNPTPGTCPDDELLASYYQGSLEQDEQKMVEEHLVLCSKCTEILIALERADNTYPSTNENFTTEDMLKRARGLIKAPEPISLREKISSWFTYPNLRPAMALASAALVVIVFSIFFQQSFMGPSSDIPLPVRFHFAARTAMDHQTRGTPEDYKEVEINEGGVLHSGDLVKITFEVQEEAYVYILAFDSKGNLNKLFPTRDTPQPVKFKPGETYSYPEENKWLELDKNTGRETIYLIASQKPIDVIDQKIDELRQSGIDKINEIFSNARVQAFSFEHK